MLRVLDLFSRIEGFSIGLERAARHSARRKKHFDTKRRRRRWWKWRQNAD